MKHLFLSLVVLLMSGTAGAAATAPDAKTTVVVLGVDHAAQLVSRQDRPALLAAFLERAKPDALCIERSPEAYARNDYYAFTYEVQDVVVPFARRNGIDLCPIDWEPSVEDAKLGFGVDLGAVPELRPASGFQQFLAFPSPSALTRDLFHADDPKNLERISRWAAATAHRGGTVVVVVGEFHKRDIEAILADSPGVRIVQPSSIGKPGEADVRRNDRREYRLAIAGFNLLGVQSTTGNIDHAFVRETLQSLKADADAPEIRLLETRLDVLQGHITPAAAVERYHAVATEAGDAPFTWTGVTDAARIDSYFDPFGNLTVRQRALLEAARELQRNGEDDAAAAIRHELGSALGKRKKAQLAAYWDRYVPKETAAEAK